MPSSPAAVVYPARVKTAFHQLTFQTIAIYAQGPQPSAVRDCPLVMVNASGNAFPLRGYLEGNAPLLHSVNGDPCVLWKPNPPMESLIGTRQYITYKGDGRSPLTKAAQHCFTRQKILEQHGIEGATGKTMLTGPDVVYVSCIPARQGFRSTTSKQTWMHW